MTVGVDAFPRKITGTDPAANVEVSETVPDGKTWEVVSVSVSLVTDANAANRRVRLEVQDDTGAVIAAYPSSLDHVASTTVRYTFAVVGEATANVASDAVTVPIPPGLVLHAGWKLVTVTKARQAGDNYGAPVIYAAEG